MSCMLCRLTMNSSQNSTGGGKRRRSVWARRLNILGIVLIFGALVVVSMRSFVVESFNDARHKSFMAPAGKMFAPDAGHFYFAAVSDTGARNEPVERIMNEIRKSKARFVLYVGDLVRYRNPSHFQWMAEEIDEKLGKRRYMPCPAIMKSYQSTGWSTALFIMRFSDRDITGSVMARCCLSGLIRRPLLMMTNNCSGWTRRWQKFGRNSSTA